MQVQSDGKAHYESRSRVSSESDETDSFDYDFTVSPATREKMFDLTAKAGYFHKDLDSHRKNLAFTGKKTLRYKDERRSGESTFNYSPDAAAQDLTSLFQGLSATLELGHRLEYGLRYQKLALAEELGAGYVSSGYRDAMGFLIIIAVLIFRPTGLFARPERVG